MTESTSRLAMLAMLAFIPASQAVPPRAVAIPVVIQPRPGATHYRNETTGAARLFDRAGGRCSAVRLADVLAHVSDVIPIPEDKPPVIQDFADRPVPRH